MINDITQNISPVTALPGLLAPERPAAVNTLVEEELPLLSTELETLVGQINTFVTETNQTATDVENNKNSAAQSAILANGLANFKGAWSGLVSYSKGESVESTSGSKIYYNSKVDSNLNHIVTDTNYWLYNPINDKLDKSTTNLTPKTTPIDADVVLIGDNVDSNITKKLTWANIKATIISSFGVMIATLTAKTTPVDGDRFIIADSASSNASKLLTLQNLKATIFGSPTLTGTPLAPTATAGTNTTQIATTAFVKSEIPSALNASGTAPIYACRAWVNFNGTGTVAIRASGNVSSITDNGVGKYTVNFATAMSDVNYGIGWNAGWLSALSGTPYTTGRTFNKSTSSFQIDNYATDVGAYDVDSLSYQAFR